MQTFFLELQVAKFFERSNFTVPFSNNFQKNAAFRENPEKHWPKFSNNSAKFWQNLQKKIAKFKFCKKSAQFSAIFNETIEIRERFRFT